MIKQLMRICFEQDLDGKQTDACVKSMAGNLLSPDRPVLTLRLNSPGELLTMMKGADSTHMLVEGGVCYFNALYSVSDKFPDPRVYFMKSCLVDEITQLGIFLDRNGLRLPIFDSRKFSEFIQDKGYVERYRSWHERWQGKDKTFRGLFDGRIKNTVVEEGMWFSSDDCLVCGEDARYMLTGTLFGVSGLMIGLRLCEQHKDEAKNHDSLIEYIAKKWDVPVPFFHGMKLVEHTDEILNMSSLAVEDELDCEIEKTVGMTITSVRKSGFRVILRQDALSNYAYMILDPNRKQVARIDSANHHVVEYGPDHVHRDIGKSKKGQVESSFTYGFVVADMKAIKALIEEAESRWNSH